MQGTLLEIMNFANSCEIDERKRISEKVLEMQGFAFTNECTIRNKIIREVSEQILKMEGLHDGD
jgi:hypothetical protein